jgi:hypothetical protein
MTVLKILEGHAQKSRGNGKIRKKKAIASKPEVSKQHASCRDG